ncbi:Leucine-rich repeat-containing protein [Artemisia annua]|uniref:Leucine-rich repeat-containing protein n=1 Tax=Artemisia annua TaxID=35608 RepID=A0A2U1KYC6_ARTAN|nr:Leucine-rich repeat-containing protein [Artemisia annua]
MNHHRRIILPIPLYMIIAIICSPHLKLAGIEFTSPKVPYQISNLSNLQTLDLASSSVVIKNTEWLSRLSSLKYLNLSYIDLSESISLLNNAVRLPSIVELHLVNCLLPNHTAKSFLSPVKNSSNSFAVLDLDSNYLPSYAIYPWLFQFNGSLTDINLSDNQLFGTIPEALGTMRNLQTLDLTNNGLEGCIPSSFSNLVSLRELRLPGNNLNQDLPSLFGYLPKRSLQVMDLYGNQISGSLPDFTKFTALKELYLGLNQLNGSFPEEFEKKSNLLILDLADNRLNGLLPDLSAFGSLLELYFERNLLNGTLAEKLAPMSNLKSLGASSNFFQGIISETHVTNLSSLVYLDLSYNSLVINISAQWSPSFQLDIISLSSCKLGDSFPGWLRTQKNFSVLDVSNTGIIDSIPSWFWESLNQGIRYLNLSSNQIHGTVPDLMSGNLPIIDMSSNNFTGYIPLFPLDTVTLMLNDNMFSGSISSLCNLTILSHLDLSKNKLSGKLPDCWKNFDRMTILNLEFNEFTGSIPDSIGALVYVSMMSMRSNSLTGELPLSLNNCTSLRLLDLGENQLAGKIPEWFGESLSTLVVLSLPSNQFNETLPTNLCSLDRLQILDLSLNKISGNIPKCLENISGMTARSPDSTIEYNAIGLERTRLTYRARYVFKALLQWKGRQSEYQKTLGLVVSIDLSSNKLSGEIPSEITSLLALVALNLSRNSLTGPIPQDIGQLRRLDFLDLSRNDLLQSFDVSSYAGNPTLCGVPLPNRCLGDDEPRSSKDKDVTEEEFDDNLINKDFYVSIVVGFAIGFWGLCGSLILKDSWRHAYFRLFDTVRDRILVTMETSFARIQRRTSLK